MRPTHRFLLFVLGLCVVGSCSAGCMFGGRKGALKLPKEAPLSRVLYNPAYANAARAAEAHLIEARKNLAVPALSAAISIEGETVWAAAVGWADVAKGVRATPRTKFRIGGTSQALTATGLARLVDGGIIDLDVPIGAIMNDLPNPKWIRMTPRQLASHTAGFPGYAENTDRGGMIQTLTLQRQYEDVLVALDVFDEAQLLYEPGQAFHDTRFDVNLLSAVMQSATGKPFLRLMDELVFVPLGMASTHADYQDRDVPARAIFYRREKRRFLPWGHVNLSLEWASGGFVSTSSDLVKLGGGWFDPEFIEPETVRAMWTPQRLANGRINRQSYAIGWRSNPTTRLLGEGRPLRAIHHGGISEGAMSWLVLYPEFEMAVALNANARTETFQDFARMESALTREFMRVIEPRSGGAN